MNDDKPHADIDRIASFARKKTLPAHAQAKVDKLVAAFQHVQLAQSIEALVQWAYDEGFKDGSAGRRAPDILSDTEYSELQEREERIRNQREYEGDYD
jgi:putative IMPACT (imprinted ancient) family translation regulator